MSLADLIASCRSGLVEGTDDGNLIRTGPGDDSVFAGAGDDVVLTGAGNDVLVGGLGADDLQGGMGQDTYVFSAGDGTDTIADTAGEGNRLSFGSGMASDAITLGRGPGQHSGDSWTIVQVTESELMRLCQALHPLTLLSLPMVRR